MSQRLFRNGSGSFVQYKDYTTSSESKPITTSAISNSRFEMCSQFQAEMILEFNNVQIEQISAFLEEFGVQEEQD
ncbi:hypothetical protein [Pseudodesulfovibrio karagichevae]|uniref:Uncharacterized protein n=1 Tax=Pseudodesulfovibrio karagichevae TaxID=3239305 RepID=A0ABV4K768_9BACT